MILHPDKMAVSVMGPLPYYSSRGIRANGKPGPAAKEHFLMSYEDADQQQIPIIFTSEMTGWRH